MCILACRLLSNCSFLLGFFVFHKTDVTSGFLMEVTQSNSTFLVKLVHRPLGFHGFCIVSCHLDSNAFTEVGCLCFAEFLPFIKTQHVVLVGVCGDEGVVSFFVTLFFKGSVLTHFHIVLLQSFCEFFAFVVLHLNSRDLPGVNVVLGDI